MNSTNVIDMSREADALDPWVMPTQQQRSRETLDRILDATETLLSDRLYEDITIAEIVDRAGCSVGAFYSRVKTKDALLKFLRERLYAALARSARDRLHADRLRDESLASRVDAVVDVYMRWYATKLGVIRAVVVNSRRDRLFRERARAFNDGNTQLVVDLWTRNADEIAHGDAVAAAHRAFIMLTGMIREFYLFGDHWRRLDQESGETFARCVSGAVAAHLSTPLSAPSASGAI